MLLGKRPRRPIRRTTSMTKFIPEVGVLETPQPQPQPQPHPAIDQSQRGQNDWLASGYVAAVATPRGGHRRNSTDLVVVETAPFLKACGLCRRRLGPGRDIFMYRGEMAFCSLECRQQQMNSDERKEKCSLTSAKIDNSTTVVAAASDSSSSGETVAAA